MLDKAVQDANGYINLNSANVPICSDVSIFDILHVRERGACLVAQ